VSLATFVRIEDLGRALDAIDALAAGTGRRHQDRAGGPSGKPDKQPAATSAVHGPTARPEPGHTGGRDSTVAARAIAATGEVTGSGRSAGCC
jgi:hypothetical protein